MPLVVEILLALVDQHLFLLLLALHHIFLPKVQAILKSMAKKSERVIANLFLLLTTGITPITESLVYRIEQCYYHLLFAITAIRNPEF